MVKFYYENNNDANVYVFIKRVIKTKGTLSDGFKFILFRDMVQWYSGHEIAHKKKHQNHRVNDNSFLPLGLLLFLCS